MRPLLNGGTWAGVENLHVPGYRWRNVVAFGVIYSAGRQVYVLLRHGRLDPEGLLFVGGIILLWALVSLARSSEPYHLSLVDGVLSGPAPHGRRRVQFRVSDIDRARSARAGLFGSRTIWSRAGEAIHLDPITVPKAGRQKILRALDLLEVKLSEH